MITYAVIGHNEAATLATALAQAREAWRPGDHIVFVDSASSDNSAAIADESGVGRLAAPIGKGRAMEYAIRGCTTEYICFVDADIYASSMNIATLLGACTTASGATMVVGEFTEDGSVLSNTWGVYDPIVAALFPEADRSYGSKPLTGFRCLRVKGVALPLPPGFGVEAHLNVTSALAGGPTKVCRLGKYEGRFRYKPEMGIQIADALFDVAVDRGRLDERGRGLWDSWLIPVVEHIATYHGDPSERASFVRQLGALARRPAPARWPAG